MLCCVFNAIFVPNNLSQIDLGPRHIEFVLGSHCVISAVGFHLGQRSRAF